MKAYATNQNRHAIILAGGDGTRLGLDKTEADTGETFAMDGVKPGPYLVLPLLPPLTVRDAFGFAADSFMDPLSLFVTPLGARLWACRCEQDQRTRTEHETV
jgi:ABC-type transporter lipoprotein component MlaA